MKRKQWTTNFREDLRKKVNILAAELDVRPNHILEIAFEHLQDELNKSNNDVKNNIKEIINHKYKRS